MWDFSLYADKVAIIEEGRASITYNELNNVCHEIGRIIEKKSLVFCLCTNSIGSIAGYVAFLNNTVVPVLLSASLEKVLLGNLIEEYMPPYLWVTNDKEDKFDGYKKIYEIYDYILLRKEYEKIYPLNNKLALLLTTSGSTGSPKFVRQSYDNIRSNINSIVEYLQLDSEERPITTLPMNYTYGLSIINTHLDVGATILATDKGLMQKEFWTFLKDQRATSLSGVPYTYEMMDRLRFTRMELPYLKTMTQAGGKLTTELHRKFAEYANNAEKKFIVMYGQCEATARMGYLPFDKALDKCGSMGIAIPGGKFRIVDSKGNDIHSSHTIGELVYEGKNVTMGYAEHGDDLIKDDERNSILETGDMAEFDDDGFYYIVGRKKRFLKIYGNRVNLDEMDQMIKGNYPDIEVATSGIDDHIFIFINNKSKLDEIRDFVIYKTGLNHTAFNMRYLEEIPKNESGKVLYKALEKYYKDEL